MVATHVDGPIARTMELFGLDAQQLADAIGCSTSTLNRWRRGDQQPSGPYLERIHLLDALLFQINQTLRSRQRAREWFDTRIPALGNHTPRAVFLGGNLAHLVVYLRQHDRL
ncbi:MAG: helix-turn-helix domain-containing protein [Gemmatimonadota bacterium]